MADAAYLQTNFLGGQWSPYAQGRGDDEHYRTAMNLCLNNVPLEVGACTRRSGSLFAATTRNGVQAALKAFHFVQANPFLAEFTAGFLRIFAGTALLVQNTVAVANISSANPAVVATTLVNVFATGDQVEFSATPVPGSDPGPVEPLFNRQFSITVIDNQHFSLQDPVTGANIDGSTINILNWQVTVARVVTFTTPYATADLPNLRLVQNEDIALSLVQTQPPQALTNTVAPVANAGAVFSWAQPTFLDGPYLDPPTDGSTLTPSATSGTITLTASSIASINGGSGFLSTDVGRMVRLFSEPANWASGTSYSKGTNVKYGNTYWQAAAANHAIEPDTDNGTNWVINPTGAAWTWGTIASVVNTSHVTITLAAADPYGVNAGGNLLYTVPILTWQLGLYSNTTGWPAGGCYHEGRFWLFGASANRLDSTMSNENYMFAPTLLDGTVADNCGISAVFEGQERNAVFWVEPDHQGIIVGTQAGEWLIQASSLNEPLTPTSIQAHRVTGYGCANVEPVYTGLSHVFVQRYGLQVYEYLADVYSQKFQGTNIARRAKNLTSPGVAQIAYQRELAPLLWARTNDGRLLSCTYKRESPFSTQPASFMAWAQHPLGSNRVVEALQVGPSPDGSFDSVALITTDPSTGIRYVEVMSSLAEETDPITKAWFLDAAVTPASAAIPPQNMLDWSNNITNTNGWIAGTGGDTFSFSTTTNPATGDTMQLWSLGASSGNHRLRTAIAADPPNAPGTVFNYSAYVKYNGQQYLRLSLVDSSASVGEIIAEFDLVGNVIATPVALATGLTGGVAVNASMTLVSAGVYRISISGSISGGTNLVARLVAINSLSTTQSNSLAPWTPPGGTGYFIGDQQLIVGPAPILYQGTNGMPGIGTNSLVLYGLDYINGKTITAWIGGIDAGDYTVSAGTITIPLDGTANGTGGLLFNQAALAALTGGNYSNLNLSIQVSPPGTGFFSPFGSLLDYTFSDSGSAHYADGLVDWDGNAAWFEQAAHVGDPQTDTHTLWQFNVATQALVAGPLDPGQLAFSGVIGGRCMGLDGNIYYGGNDATHRVGRYNTHTQTNDLNFVDTSSLDDVGNLQTITLGSNYYAFYASLNSGGSGSRINVINMTDLGGPAWTGQTFTVAEAPGTLTSSNAFTVRGRAGTGVGYVVAGDAYPAIGAATVMGIYTVQVVGPTLAGMVRTGGITPANINSVAGTSWTSFSMGNPIFDETDGNIIMVVEGSDSTFRLLKFNPTKATVVWVSNTLTIATLIDLSRYRIRGGRMTLIGGGSSPWIVYQVNTLSGALNTSNTQSLVSPGVLMGDDKTGFLVMEINNLSTQDWATFGPAVGGGTITPAVVYNAPAVIGFNYKSQGQILRAINPQEAGTPNGPAQAKTRRIHMFGALMVNSQGVYYGTDFNYMQGPAAFTSPGETSVLPLTTLYSGTWWDAIDDDYGFDGMWAWEVRRPYPTTVVSVECFIHGQDR